MLRYGLPVCAVGAIALGVTDIVLYKTTGRGVAERLGEWMAHENPGFWGGNSWFAQLFD